MSTVLDLSAYAGLDVVGAVQYAMATDDDNQSERLIAFFAAAAPEVRATVDDVLIMLCGYSMNALLQAAKPMGEV